jgi:hypothetical protein
VLGAVRILCFSLLTISSPALARTCIVPRFSILDNQIVSGTMYAVSAKPCSVILLQSRGPTYSARVITPPKNGSVAIKGPRIVYVSRPGYVGEDWFVYAREGMDPVNRPVTRTVEMSVKVVGHW